MFFVQDIFRQKCKNCWFCALQHDNYICLTLLYFIVNWLLGMEFRFLEKTYSTYSQSVNISLFPLFTKVSFWCSMELDPRIDREQSSLFLSSISCHISALDSGITCSGLQSLPWICWFRQYVYVHIYLCIHVLSRGGNYMQSI